MQMAVEDLSDLDFTRVGSMRTVMKREPAPAPRAPAVTPRAPAPAPREPAAAPREPVPAPREGVRPQAMIGTSNGGNFIAYARSPEQPVAHSDAPVVVVEDDEITRRLLERVLTLQGFTVRTAADGQEFAQVLRQRPLPRLVLLDVELPKVSGFRLLTLLRQHPQTSAIPVVMLTGRTDNKDLMQGLSLGADAYLSKPVSVDSLRQSIERVLGLWKQ